MKRYTVANTQRTGTNTTVLQLRPSDGSRGINYRAGQYVGISFRRGTRRTPMRCFSATTAPSDSGELGLAFRNGGAFTAALAEIEPGTRVDIAGPFGEFIVSRDETRPLLFLAGGIGITPFLSILRDLDGRRNAQPVTLLYSTNSLQDVPFARELMDLAKRNANYTIRFLTTSVPSDKQGHPLIIQSRLSDDVILEYATTDTQYYVCGPQGYATAANEMLESLGVEEWAIHNEAFSQSSKMTIAGFAVQKLVYGLLGAAIVVGAGLFTAKDLLKFSNTNAGQSAASQTYGTGTSASSTSGATDTTQNTATSSAAQQQYYYTPPRSMMS